eukprot:COSAG01_NODE_2380_length_7793_cov_118.038602_6_plen_76_part_00
METPGARHQRLLGLRRAPPRSLQLRTQLRLAQHRRPPVPPLAAAEQLRVAPQLRQRLRLGLQRPAVGRSLRLPAR